MADNEVVSNENKENNQEITSAVETTAAPTQPAAPAHKSSAPWAWIIGALVLVLAAVGVWFFVSPDQLGSPAKKVGAIDQEAIFALDEFKNAQKEIQAFADSKKAEFEKAQKAKAGKEGGNAELENLYRKMQLEMTQKRNEISNPLQVRAEAAVATVARSKGLTVVLDKRIVVCGVPDITEDVKKVFQQKGELKIPDEQDTSKCPIAYFDQSVVRSLKVFSESDIKLIGYRNDMMAKYEKEAPKLSVAERETMQREMSARLDALREQLQTPLYQKVTNSVNQVAKAQGISLVLDKQNVMYGGRNITDSVVETFLSEVNGSDASTTAPATGSAAPASSTKSDK